MRGDTMGDQIVSLQQREYKIGILPNHAITTGLEFLYEGITIATISANSNLTPLVYGSAGNLVTACYEKDGKRAIIDGGFTRLYIKWDTAGTARFVKNAAAWLANVEREAKEGETVVKLSAIKISKNLAETDKKENDLSNKNNIKIRISNNLK